MNSSYCMSGGERLSSLGWAAELLEGKIGDRNTGGPLLSVSPLLSSVVAMATREILAVPISFAL